MKKVIVIGGGVAGMSAAHELAERGFLVDVYEHKKKYCGGKARSVDVPGSVPVGQKHLPGEHGFRFFPGFYKHIVDTMKRIPAGNGKTVYDNLTPTEHITFARNAQEPIILLAHFPRTLKEIEFAIQSVMQKHNTGLTGEEIKFFAERLWQLITSSADRRMNDYERLGWWEYLQADRFSDAYRSLLVDGLTRSLVASRAETASTRTGGDVFLQLIFNMLDPFVNADRVLNGPTNEVWLNCWMKHLHSFTTVNYSFGNTATEILCDDKQITGIKIKNTDNKETVVTGDYYLIAVPVEQISKLINPALLKLDATLSCIQTLAPSVNWMNGMQFYLNTEVSMNRGHVILNDSQWAVTCISQVQFWQEDIKKYGDGNVKSVISVDISDWFAPGFNGKRACDCTRDEIKDEVWKQMETAFNVNGTTVIDKNTIVAWYLDRDIITPTPDHNLNIATPHETDFDKEPLLVNSVNTWSLRPEAHTEVPNLFLAGDYVRTYTDLATMEGANESARRAVNCIIQSSGANVLMCKVWNLHEPFIFAPFRWADERRYEKGLPWSPKLPWVIKAFVFFLKPLSWLISKIRNK